MITNLVLMKESEEVLELSRKLGFDKTLFLDQDFVLVVGEDKKKLLKEMIRSFPSSPSI